MQVYVVLGITEQRKNSQGEFEFRNIFKDNFCNALFQLDIRKQTKEKRESRQL